MTTDPRTGIVGLVALIVTALGLTFNFLLPDIPNPIWVAWGAVLMYAARLGEIWYDSRPGRTSTPTS